MRAFGIMTQGKRLLLSCALLLTLQAQAQDIPRILNLNGTYTGIQDFVAEKEINFSDFEYQAETGETFVAQLRYHEILDSFGGELMVDPQNPPSNRGEAGMTSSSFSVSPSGSFNYQIPIVVTPGTNDMTPQLAIVYNSLANDGIVGRGFTLSGLSSITRGPATFFHDDLSDPVDFDNNDKLLIDGERLVRVAGGNYGKSTAEYRTENNRMAKIVEYGDIDGNAYFKVWERSGLIKYYGGTDAGGASQIYQAGETGRIHTWLLSRIEDRSGNYITVSYDKTDGQYLPLKIDYTGNNSGHSPFASVEFEYEQRAQGNDIIRFFVAGGQNQIRNRLKKIINKYGETTFREYVLDYEEYDHQPYLTSVTEYGENGESGGISYTPITFDWGQEVKGFETASAQNDFLVNIPSISSLPEENPDAFATKEEYAGDFNGDGKVNLLTVEYYWVYGDYNPGNITFYSEYRWTLYGEINGALQILGSGAFSQVPDDLFIGDFDGDGDSDLLSVAGNGDCRLYSYNGSTLTNTSFGSVPAHDHLDVADFNGDGLMDLLLGVNGALSGRESTFHFSTGTGFTQSGSYTGNYAVHMIADFNGDGAADLYINGLQGGRNLLLMDKNNNGAREQIPLASLGYNWPDLEDPNIAQKTVFGDFNGDGLMDIVLMDDPWGVGYWPVYYGNGVDFTLNQIQIDDSQFLREGSGIFPGLGAPYNYSISAIDLNGDGKSDLLIEFEDAQQSTQAYLQGNNRFYYAGPAFSRSGRKALYGDFTGNGTSDVMLVPNFASTCVSGTPCLVKRFDLELTLVSDYRKLPLAVRSVANSLHARTFIDYSPLTDPDVYTKYSNATGNFLDVISPMQVVSDLYTDDGIGGVDITSYRYEGAKVHTRGKGFMGFQKVTTESVTQGLVNTQIYDWENAGKIPLLKRETSYSNAFGQMVAEVDIQYTNIDDGYTDTYLFAKTEETASSYEPTTGTRVTSVRTRFPANEYDQYGNIGRVEQTHLLSTGHTTTTVNTYKSADLSRWIIDRIETAAVIRTVPGGGSETRHSSFTYFDVTGYLETETIEPGHSLELTTTYQYDAYGNIQQASRAGSGQVRIDKVTYGSTHYGRFPTREENALGHVTVNQFDPVSGNITRTTDPNNEATDFQYDDFGRLHQVIGPEVTTTTSYYWADANGPSQSSYYVEITTPGQPAVQTHYDRLGRVRREGQIGFSGNYVIVDTEYNGRGQVSRVSEPYYAGASAIWSTYVYDGVGRITTLTQPGGRTTSTTYDGFTTLTNNANDQDNKRTVNALGQLEESEDNGNTILEYTYHPNGQTETIQVKGRSSTRITMGYDQLGNTEYVDDPDLGRFDYDYNAYGELITQVSARNTTTSFQYDLLGRMTHRDIGSNDHNTEWIWDDPADVPERWTGALYQVNTTSPAGTVSRTHEYGAHGRVEKTVESLPGTGNYTTRFNYLPDGKLDKLTYPGGFKVKHHYDPNHGYLQKVTSEDNTVTYWEAIAENARGQLTEYQQGGQLATFRDYDPSTGYHSSTQTRTSDNTVLHHLGFKYDPLGNLTSRSDHLISLTERFDYDNLNRLRTTEIVGKTYGSLSMDYDDLGNLTYKSDVGNYFYEENTGGGPHALSRLDPSTVANSRIQDWTQDITYTAFEKVATITDRKSLGDERLDFIYGVDLERKVTETYIDNTLAMTKRFIGGIYEEEQVAGGEVRALHYILARGEAVAIHTVQGTSAATHYLLKDHLGSVSAIADEAGNVLERMSYDAWGNRRDATDWQLLDDTQVQTNLHDRGFTGHEHLDAFRLVNMNGRVYDPVLGRFLSADPFTQFPDYTQGLNRYTYVLNNPLSYTDPSGYNVSGGQIADAAISIGLSAILGPGGALLGGFFGGMTGALLDGTDLNAAFEASIKGAVFKAASAQFAMGVGSSFGHGTGPFIHELSRAGSHGISQGLIRHAQGGNFWHGFASGSVGSLAGSYSRGVTVFEGIVITAVAGGASEVLAGGNFADGAITGAYTYLFNHVGKTLATNSERRKTNKYVNEQIASGNGVDLRNLFPVAIQFGIDLDLVFGSGYDFTFARIIVLQGIDAGQVFDVFDRGEAVGIDLSLSGEATLLFYTGDISNFNANLLEGSRSEISISGIPAFFGATWGGTGFVSEPDIRGGRVIGVGVNLGWSIPGLNKFDVNLNQGQTTVSPLLFDQK